MGTTAEVHRERELKLDVPAEFEVPDVADVVPGGEIERGTVALSSTYYDTVELDLLAHRVTLRRRTGDADNGWHLKIPAGNARDEFGAPLDSSSPAGPDDPYPVPDALADLLVGVVRPAELAPVARLDTERRLTRVHRGGELVVEIADDRVTASAGGRTESWREVEIELGAGGSERDLAAFAKQLHRAGARPSASGSKLARALGNERRDTQRSPAGEQVAAYVGEAHRRLVAADIALRRGHTDAVRDARAATRRVRSVLRVFRDVVRVGIGTHSGNQESGVRALDAELAWFQGLLGPVRDLQVQLAHFREALDALPPALVPGPVAARLEQTLVRDETALMADVTAALATNRYRRMLAALAAFDGVDPVMPGTARSALRERATTAMQTAARRLREARDTDDPALLHRARKCVRRARYSAELVGRPDKTLRDYERVQDALGEHRDALLAAHTAHWCGAAATAAGGENGFTFGLLHQRELQRAQHARAAAHDLRLPR